VKSDDDIVARVESAPSTASTLSKLQGYLADSCGHVVITQRVVAQGYRFHSWMSDEIPHFFNKRMSTGTTSVAITLQGGMSIDGEDPFALCTSTADARTVIEDGGHDGTIWVAKITVDARMFDVAEVAASPFLAQHPDEFRLIAEELIALGVLGDSGCPMCAEHAAEGLGNVA
jgi:hypothetical protein